LTWYFYCSFSTTFTKETHLSLDLPEATGEEQEIKVKQIEIIIDVSGQYVINGKSLVSSKLETIIVALKKVSEGNIEMPLVITADANTPHQSVITAMDAAGQLGFSRLSLSTKRPADK
jgi:biopolymer transport protein ExbD